MTNSVLRTTKHYFNNFANTGKQEVLHSFLADMRSVVNSYISYLWNNRIVFGKDCRVLDVKNGLYDCPQFISNEYVPDGTLLSKRAIKCASTQACGIVKGTLTKIKKLNFAKSEMLKAGKDITRLQEKIDKISFSMPEPVENFPIELNSICIEFNEGSKHFNGYITLSSIGKKYGKIRIPIKYTKLSNKYKNKPNAILKNSFLLTENNVDFRWEFPVEMKTKGIIVGGDTGVNKVIVLSDTQRTTADKYGHDLHTITDKLARKKKGSKNFLAAQRHRTNYVNAAINNLDFSNIKQINLEDVFDLNRGKRT